ncbi:tandem large repeat, partial [Vibrio sp. V39_P1S14PM300]|uniref:tandem large repeat n=1 Tax=Vibrio sp. V39_P1S14PM300 TaxID=1938690 RepID=UPI0013729279
MTLASCGGGGGGGSKKDSTPPDRATGTISGKVYDAPVSGATVSVWEYKDGKLGRKLGESKSDQSGYYSVPVKSSSMPVYVKASGGAYRDPITEEVISASNGKTMTMSSVANFSEGTSQSIMLTPLSNMATGLAEYKIERGESATNAVTSSVNTISDMYGFDVNETTPIDITKGGQSSNATDGHKYGALLTAYSSYAKDLIDRYPTEESKTLYTSMHLSDIQYRDIRSDGVLDGKEADANGVELGMSFGQVDVNSELYTNVLSQHVMIVVNDPALNVSGTKPSEYRDFSEQLNKLGTPNGNGGALPPRDEVAIDQDAPTVTRNSDSVLAGDAKIIIDLKDDVGVKDLTVKLQLETANGWSEEMQCTDGYMEQYCKLDLTDFTSGIRATQASVEVDTFTIDRNYPTPDEGEPLILGARLVVYAEDVLGNYHESNSGVLLPFFWDNVKPVIEVESSPTINSTNDSYNLQGWAMDSTSEIASLTISLGEDDFRDITCREPAGEKCAFNEPYPATGFGAATTFTITATDAQGNETRKEWVVTKDNSPPTQSVTYPNIDDAQMAFISIAPDGSRGLTELKDYTSNTFTESNISTTQDHLKVDFVYARSGLKAVHQDIDFADFNASALTTLKNNHIPYIKVKVQDDNFDVEGGAQGTSAEDLKVTVRYYVKSPTDNDYNIAGQVSSHDAFSKPTGAIPHEEIIKNGEEPLSYLNYYVPFVQELLEDNYASVPERSEQKITITTEDRSGNLSDVSTIYFRSTFDLPTFNVVTPFANALVELRGLNSKGNFDSNPVASCTTRLVEGATDVATCQLRSDLGAYQFLQLKLSNPGAGKAYYYQWSNKTRRDVDLSNAHLGAYFDALNPPSTIYLTELSAYHTGLFDYIWSQQSEHTYADAKAYLQQVVNALASKSNASFFGFDPVLTGYATNEDLKEILLNDEFFHRFIVEGLLDLTGGSSRISSVEYAAAFYDDLAADGKADGVNSQGQQIFVNGDKVTSETYRQVLAMAVNNVMTSFGISVRDALEWADVIAKAYPSITVNNASQNIFTQSGGSIDGEAPSPTVTASADAGTGSVYKADNETYVAGLVKFNVQIEDASKIKNSPIPVFSALWRPLNGSDTKAFEKQLKTGTDYQRSESFDLNTKDEDSYPGIDQLTVAVEAEDVEGNNHNPPHYTVFVVDNDYPSVEYKLPAGVSNADTYLNIQGQIPLRFAVTDRVGDIPDERKVLFVSKDDPSKTKVFTKDELKNVGKDTTLELCLSCEGESKHTLDNGNWKVYFVAEDKLQNKRDQNTYGVETFTVNIDSTSPVARSEGTAEIPKVLGGNDEWPPRSLILLADDGQSPLSEISVKYKAPLSEVVDLVQCADDLSTETAPACLIAEQPDVKVRLIARNINASVDGVHQFFVVAKNAAVPAGTSSQGVLTFTPDIVGPAMMLDTPWARDTISTQGNVLGKSFDVHFTSITDASGVEAVSLYQKHTDGSEDTLVKEQVLSTQPVGSYKLNVAESEANNIDLKGSESDKVYLYVKAKDKKGFESELPSRQVRIDRNGPTLSLNVADISKNYFYTKNGYEFTLNAVDYDGSNLDNQSNDGVNKDTIRYWIYPVDQTKPDIDGTTPSGDAKRLINVLAESDVTLHVEASNTRGFSNSQSFNIRVDNNVPDIKELQASYKADSSLISDGGFVNQTGDIVFTLRAEDISGTKTPEAFYKFNGGASIPLAMQKGEDNQWSVTLGIDKTSQDGLYTFEFSVEDNVVYPGNMQSNPNTAKRTYTLNVQREGVALTKVTSPANFATYISGKSLNVEFEHSGEAQVEKLECWIRDSWNGSGNQVPDNQDPPYQLVLPSDKSYSCQLEGIAGQSMKNPVLITRTFTQNKAEKVSLFSFAGLDTTVPTVVKDEADSNWVNGKYFLNEKSVLTVDGKKKFVTKLKFSDDFSGVYSEDAAGSSAGKPTLSKVSALDILLSKDKCEPLSGGGLACDFSGEVNSLLPGTNSTGEFEFVVKALEDKAGNKADPQPIVIVRPRGQIEASIESPAAGTSIEANVSASLEVKFKYKAYEGSEVTDYTVSVDGQAYVFSEDTSARFGQASDCGDGYFCNTFKYQLLSSDIDKSKLKVVVEVTDVWGLTSTPQEVSVELDGTAPVLEAVQFDPQVASSGQSVKVTAQFSEIVTSVTGSLGAEGGISNVVQWTQDDVNLMVWHGTVTAPAVGDNVTDLVLKVNEYSDVAGNKGEANSNFRLPLLPTLAVNTINDVNSTNVSSVAISGTSTRFSDGDKLALHFYSQGSEITHQVGGTLEATVSNHTWQTTVDLSSVADGEVSVMAEGTNAKGAKVQSEQIQFNLSATLPNIVSNDISLDQIPVVNGQENTVTLTFSKPVKDVSAKLGEVNISFSSGEEYLKTWVGSVTPQLKAGEVSQRVVVQTGYSDLAGNTGASQEALFNVQPELFVNTITADDVILVDEAQALVLSGSALGFEQGDTLSITLSGANSETTTIEATFSSDSEWSSSPVDIADWSEGNVSVTVSGSNQNGTSANASREATMSGTQPALSNVTFNPTHQVSGESVNVSLTFNKKVSGVKATLGSADVQLTANPEGTVWNGNVVVPSVDATDAVALTVTDYQDEYGNIGSANSDYSLAYSPQMAVTVMPDQVNESDAKSVIISGTFTHVASSTMTLQLKGATQQTAAQPLNYDANAGTWASSAYDISGFTDGPITLIFGGDVTVANSITVNASELAPADKTLTLNQQKPGVSNISVDTLRDGSAAVVNVTFSESVTEGAVTIAGVNTTLTGSGSTWTATTTSEIALSATQETVNVEVSGFKNAAENALDAHSQTVNTPVTWALTPNQDTPYSQEQAKSVVISGQTTGLAAGASITVVAKQAGSTLQSETAQVLSGGQWSVSLDLSASDGEVSVQASATRNAQTFESETQTLQLDTQAPSVDGIPQLTPATPLSGETVAVKVNFTKAIT